MFTDEPTAGETAIGYADDFVDAAVAKLDKVFGKGFAKSNPAAFSAYLSACASNLNSFMVAATAMQQEIEFDEALSAFDDMEMEEADAFASALKPTTKRDN